MRKPVVLLALALPVALSACSRDPRSRLQGKWQGESVTNLPPERALEAAVWAKAVSFSFEDEKLTVTIPSEQPRSGKYDVDDSNGDAVTIRVAAEHGEAQSATMVLGNNGELRWAIGDGREVVMNRVD